jgi:hypothetical protein
MRTVRGLSVAKRGVLVPVGTEVEWDKLFHQAFNRNPSDGLSSEPFPGSHGFRRLARDHEGVPQNSEAFIKLSASRRMLSLLAPPFP